MLFSIIGISHSLLLSSCGETQTEYRLDVVFVFVNETDRSISFSVSDPGINPKDSILLLPGSRDTIQYIASGSFENPNPNTCCNGLLGDIIGEFGKSIVFDDSTCQLESILYIENYMAEEIEDRFFSYTFSFSNDVLNDLKNCR